MHVPGNTVHSFSYGAGGGSMIELTSAYKLMDRMETENSHLLGLAESAQKTAREGLSLEAGTSKAMSRLTEQPSQKLKNLKQI